MEHRIVHFITNQCSEKEILELNNWAENEPQEFNHHAELYHVYMMAKAITISEGDVDSAFRRLQERINSESIEIEMRRPWWQSRHIAAFWHCSWLAVVEQQSCKRARNGERLHQC